MDARLQLFAFAECGGAMRLEDFKDVAVGLINDALANMHTVTVAKVTQVKDKTINCKPVMSRVVNGEKIDLPEFSDVPPINLHGGSVSYLSMPIAIGDYCLLFISERCFDGWYNGQDFEMPLEYRMHDYSDSFALVGVKPSGAALTIPDIIEFMGDKLMNGNHEHNGDNNHTGDLINSGNISTTGKMTSATINVGGQEGVSGTFTSNDGKTITVTKGIITAIV